MRRRCASFTSGTHSSGNGGSPQQQLLSPSTPRARVVSPRPPRGASPEPWSSPDTPRGAKMFPDVLRSKLTRIHDGLRKSRTFSVHEVVHQPENNRPATFYVPSPLKSGSDGELDEFHHHRELRLTSLPPSFPVKDRGLSPARDLDPRKPPSTCSSGRGSGTPTEELDRRSDHSNRSSVSSSASGRRYDNPGGEWDHGYHSIEGVGLESECDSKGRRGRVTFATDGGSLDYDCLDARNQPKTRSCRRWSQADTLVLQRFVVGGAVTRREPSPPLRDAGPPSLQLDNSQTQPPPLDRPLRLSRLPTRSSGDLQRHHPPSRHKVRFDISEETEILNYIYLIL